jgi:hypothetical protein
MVPPPDAARSAALHFYVAARLVPQLAVNMAAANRRIPRTHCIALPPSRATVLRLFELRKGKAGRRAEAPRPLSRDPDQVLRTIP